MKLIHLRRKLWLYRQIHQFNEIGENWLEPSWRAQSATEPSIQPRDFTSKYYEINDQWLKLLSLPLKQFERVMRLSVLFAIYGDGNLLISGKHLQILHQTFTKYELKHAAANKQILINNNSVPLTLLKNIDWVVSSAYKITSLIYNDTAKHEAMALRYKLRFPKNLTISDDINEYWNKFNVEQLEQFIGLAMQQIVPHINMCI